MNTYSVPILFIIFNRLDIACKSFEEIKKVKPKKLYIASDAARENKEGEQEVVDKTRKTILNAIDWDCEVKTLFQEKNLGCGIGVYTAINWLFQNEDKGIVLEDDCIVDQSFFTYVEEMLNKYENDTRIGMIAGTNPIEPKRYMCKHSYLFSKYKSCWGWATWRRAWSNMEIDMKWLNEYKDFVIHNAGYQSKDTDGWKYKLKCIDNNYVSAWDWQWYLTLAAQNQLCIYPQINLVSNIGNDENATHTSFSSITYEKQTLTTPFTHPKYVVPDCYFDYYFYKNSNTLRIRLLRLLPFGIKSYIKSIISKIQKICQK